MDRNSHIYRTEFRCNLDTKEKQIFDKIESRDKLRFKTANQYLKCAVVAFEEEENLHPDTSNTGNNDVYTRLLSDIRQIVQEEIEEARKKGFIETEIAKKTLDRKQETVIEQAIEGKEELEEEGLNPLVMDFMKSLGQ